MTRRLMICKRSIEVELLVVQERDYLDLAVLHYESQTRTDTLNTGIMSEVKSIGLKM